MKRTIRQIAGIYVAVSFWTAAVAIATPTMTLIAFIESSRGFEAL